jgi:hypothetical protein
METSSWPAVPSCPSRIRTSNSDLWAHMVVFRPVLPYKFWVHNLASSKKKQIENNISAQGKVYRTVFHVNKNKTVPASRHVTPELSNVPADCDLNTQQAKSLVEFCQYARTASRDQPPPPLLVENRTVDLPGCYVTALADKQSKIVRLTGGKGSSLAMLSSLRSSEVNISTF